MTMTHVNSSRRTTMNRLILSLTAAAAVVFSAAAARADLCPKCKGGVYDTAMGTCQECKELKAVSSSFKLCPACSKKLGQCERCRAKLTGDVKIATGDASPTQPAEAGEKVIALDESSDGKTVAAAVPQKIAVALKGNPTTGFGWFLGKIDGEAVVQEGKIEYVASPKPPGMVGGGGVFVATFKAAAAGKATVTLEYKRPWEKDKPPAKTFTITIEIKAQASSQPGKADEPKQGVTGKVIKMKGDFMPGPGPARGTRTPLSVPVWVFKGKVKTHEKPDPQHPSLVTTVKSDKDGVYRVSLPPGVYTVVAEINGKLYLNSFDGDGNWGSIKVEADAWTTFDIKDTSEAAF
jgi:inhibitor of cysteine peptidase